MISPVVGAQPKGDNLRISVASSITFVNYLYHLASKERGCFDANEPVDAAISPLLTGFPMKKKITKPERTATKNESVLPTCEKPDGIKTSDLYHRSSHSFRRELDVTAGVSTSTDNIRMILESDLLQRIPSEYF